MLLDYGHENLEKTLPGKTKPIENILEIGPGVNPHLRFVRQKFQKYFFAETFDYAADYLTNKFADNECVEVDKYDGFSLNYESSSFDRVIICHTLEHIPNPEKMLFEMDRVLKSGGILSISLPCDPGLLWRAGRCLTTARAAKKKLGFTKTEYYYVMSKEHINSINNLVALLSYHFSEKLREYYLPFYIKSYDINLVYNCHVLK